MKPVFELAPRGGGALRTVFVDFTPGIAAAIGGLFIYAGLVKMGDPAAFARDISNFHLLPWAVGVPLAFYLPWLEMFCGAALFLGWKRGGAIIVLTTLTVVFIVAMIVARMRGIDVDCGCFGHATKGMSFGWHLALNFLLLGGLIFLWRLHRKRAP